MTADGMEILLDSRYEDNMKPRSLDDRGWNGNSA